MQIPPCKLMARLINQPMAANLTARTYTKLNIADNEREIRNKEYGMQTLCRRKCSLALVKISTAMSMDSIMQLPTCFAVNHYYRLLLSTFAVDFCCQLLCCKVLLSTFAVDICVPRMA